jgi:hypothetical protein
MAAILKVLASDPSSGDDRALNEIIEFGKKALRQRWSEELAFDLLGLDGVPLPLGTKQGAD